MWTLVTSDPLDATLAPYRSQTTGTSHEFSVFHPGWPAGRWEQHVRTIINIYIVLHLHNKSINESEFLQKAAALQLPVVQSRWKHFCVCPLRDTNAGCNWIRQEHGAHTESTRESRHNELLVTSWGLIEIYGLACNVLFISGGFESLTSLNSINSDFFNTWEISPFRIRWNLIAIILNVPPQWNQCAGCSYVWTCNQTLLSLCWTMQNIKAVGFFLPGLEYLLDFWTSMSYMSLIISVVNRT